MAPPETSPPRSQDIIQIDPTALNTSVSVAPVQTRQFPDQVEVTGRVGLNENRTSFVGAIAEGRVAEIRANVGDQVGEGSILAFLYSQQVHEGRADYAQAIATLGRRKAELELARTESTRAARLFELKAGSLADKQRAEADLQEAETFLLLAQAELGRIEEHLSHLGVTSEGALEEYTQSHVREEGTYEEDEMIPVVSPQRGTVIERLVGVGNVVTPASNLFLISDMRQLWVHAEVPEQHLALLKPGMQVSLSVQAYPQEEFPASVHHIGNIMNPATRTVHVICQANNPGTRLKSEMYATIKFALSEGRTSIAVPEDAVQTVEGKEVVFVSEGEGRFRKREVRTGLRRAGEVEILEGLEPESHIVTSGAFLLKSELLRGQIEE